MTPTELGRPRWDRAQSVDPGQQKSRRARNGGIFCLTSTSSILSFFSSHPTGRPLKVRKYESEIDYSIKVEQTFDKFKQKAVRDYTVKFTDPPDMNHIEGKILDFLSQLYPDIFLELDSYFTKHSDYLDEAIRVFDREVQFYVAYLNHVSRFRRAGFQFCYPVVSNNDKEVYAYEAFDLALACKLIAANSPVVRNDFYLEGEERIFVVSGPNQGGKTTFARTFGQLHYLAIPGCPVPGREARLFLFDELYTHFEQEEDINNLRGKLEDDLVRFHDILNHAKSSSIIIMNEILTSTTLKDAVFLGRKVIRKISCASARAARGSTGRAGPDRDGRDDPGCLSCPGVHSRLGRNRLP
jgi:DNA mismatch repair protein MutS